MSIKISSFTPSSNSYDAEQNVGRMPSGKSVTIKSPIGQNSDEQTLLENINKLFGEGIIERKDLSSIAISNTDTDTIQIHATYIGRADSTLVNVDASNAELIGNILRLSKEILKPSSSSTQTDIPILLTMVEEPEIETSTKKSPQEILQESLQAANASLKRFNEADNRAKNTYYNIESAETSKLIGLMTKYNEMNTEIEKIVKTEGMSPTEKNKKLSALKSNFNEFSASMRIESEDASLATGFYLETNLVGMTKEYNQVHDLAEKLAAQETRSPEDEQWLKKLNTIKAGMKAAISQINAKMIQKSLTTHISTAHKSHVMNFAALVEKKMDLQLEKSELQMLYDEMKTNSKPGHLEASLKLSYIKDKINDVEKKLKKAPKESVMNSLVVDIKAQLEGNSTASYDATKNKKGLLPCLFKIKEAFKLGNYKRFSLNPKKLLKSQSHFAWGADHLNKTLTTPANWTTIRKAFIKESGSEKMYVAVTESKPLNIGSEGGVPAGLRSAQGYEDRATNLIKETTYIKSDDGSQHICDVSFRGGQFPTIASAKDALTQIMKECGPLDPQKASLHVGSLLTPLINQPWKKDRALLTQHEKSIRGAIDELIKEKTEKRENAASKERKKVPSADTVGADAVSADTVSADTVGADAVSKERKKADAVSAAVSAAVNAYSVEIAYLKKLKESTAVSNLGVNEGAVGEKRVIIKLRLGWHRSISKYSNAASEKLTTSLHSKFDSMSDTWTQVRAGPINFNASDIQDLDRLGAMVQVGQEMEAVWATNAYADAKVGNNQFKLPALWKTMDTLLGVTHYTNCMSGKDRTGKVVSHSQAQLDEIAMNTIEHKKKLTAQFESFLTTLSGEKKKAFESKKDVLTAACFTEQDVASIFEEFQKNPSTLDQIVNKAVQQKITQAQLALGMAKTGDAQKAEFMPQKKFSAFSLQKGVSGISKTTPKREIPEYQKAASGFPQLAASTMFSKDVLNWDKLGNNLLKLGDLLEKKGIEVLIASATAQGEAINGYYAMTPDYRRQIGLKAMLKEGKKRQAEAINSRHSQASSLAITQMNTGKPGFKVEGGEPLNRSSSGFDRDYVLLTLYDHRHDKRIDKNELISLLGLNEFDMDTKNTLLDHFDEASRLSSVSEKMQHYISLVKEVEHLKMETFFPKAKVKA